MTENMAGNYILRRSERSVQTGVTECDAAFSRLGERVKVDGGQPQASVWGMNCRGCKIVEVFEAGVQTRSGEELEAMRDLTCQKGQQVT